MAAQPQGTLGGKPGDESPYEMTVNLTVVESLGINLYSNAAAVLSELVANAYDADAQQVDISWQPDGRIVVADDGLGMTIKQVNDRFLKVGYKKRTVEGGASPRFSRPFMGRKGIGKLSVFSLARRVTVYTAPATLGEPGETPTIGQPHGLQIDVDQLLADIRASGTYRPTPVQIAGDYPGSGTMLVLDEVRLKRAGMTKAALRKRLARRFNVLGDAPTEAGRFALRVDGEDVTYRDRVDLKKLQFVWEFGEARLPTDALPDDVQRFVLPDDTIPRVKLDPVAETTADDGASHDQPTDEQPGVDSGAVAAEPPADWRVRGWIGTAHTPSDLSSDEEAGSLKDVIVLARKRPIQETIKDKLDFARIFGSYVTGQIEADFLDLDDADDIATSDRQRLIEDDPRVIGLQKLLRDAFKAASEQWAELRPKKEVQDVFANHPLLRTWVDDLPDYQQPIAEKMLGTIAATEIEGHDGPAEKLALFRAGVLAFERLGLRDAIADLDQLSEVTADKLLPLLGRADNYELALWGDILRARIEAIDQFRSLSDDDEKERVLQEHLFDKMWLIDPSWERATESLAMEESIRHVDPDVLAVDAEQEEITGRFDIRYRTVGGQNVIVELKRYGRSVTVEELTEQGHKYHQALRSILDEQGRGHEHIEVVFVLGKVPRSRYTGTASNVSELASRRFQEFNGRFVLYDGLIGQAKRQYEEYLRASDQADTLEALLTSLGAELDVDLSEPEAQAADA